MDYGQLAYIKAEEIETYLRKAAQSADRRVTAKAAFYPRVALENGYEPCSVYGSGSVGLSVSAVLSSPSGVNGVKVRLYCGDKIAAYTSVTLSAGDSANYTLLASVYPQDGEKLKLVADGYGLLLEEMSVLADGNGVYVTSGQENFKSDYIGSDVFLLSENNGEIELSKYGGAKVIVAHGSIFDLVAASNEIKVLCCDDNDNMVGVTYSPDMKETGRRYLGSGMHRVAVGRGLTGLTLAAVKERKVYLAQCNYDFSGMTEWARADFETEADDVFFCKQTDNPVLFLQRGNAVFAKLPVLAKSASDVIAVLPSITVG